MKKAINGFTLLELMMVIAIIGLIIVLVIPNIKLARENFKLYTFARNCVLDLRYAQQLSIDTKEEHKIYFFMDSYQIVKEGNEIIKTVNNKGVIFEGIEGIASNEIVFKTSGEPYEAGKIRFKSSSSDVKIFVNVTPGTGEVSVKWN